ENLAAKIIQNNDCGFVITPGDKTEFINKAFQLYQSSDLRIRFSLNSRKYAEENFDIEKITDKFESIVNLITK
ncbi:MAG: glycosyltransferase, partial [Nitrososphaeria archaeon]